jgi:CO/xanthine dehydrogenase FAD-binding subunit
MKGMARKARFLYQMRRSLGDGQMRSRASVGGKGACEVQRAEEQAERAGVQDRLCAEVVWDASAVGEFALGGERFRVATHAFEQGSQGAEQGD